MCLVLSHVCLVLIYQAWSWSTSATRLSSKCIARCHTGHTASATHAKPTLAPGDVPPSSSLPCKTSRLPLHSLVESTHHHASRGSTLLTAVPRFRSLRTHTNHFLAAEGGGGTPFVRRNLSTQSFSPTSQPVCDLISRLNSETLGDASIPSTMPKSALSSGSLTFLCIVCLG